MGYKQQSQTISLQDSLAKAIAKELFSCIICTISNNALSEKSYGRNIIFINFALE